MDHFRGRQFEIPSWDQIASTVHVDQFGFMIGKLMITVRDYRIRLMY